MLREIRPEEVAEYERDEVKILMDDVLYTADEIAEQLDLRFLVDFEDDDPEEEETDPEEEESEEEEMNPEEDGELESIPVIIQSESEMKICETKPKRKRRSPEEIKRLIRYSINAGNSSMAAVQRDTGLAYETVRKYWDEV